MLEELQKSLEKQLIRNFVASQSQATTQNRKKMTQQTLQQIKKTINGATTTYSTNLSKAAQGKWVTAAKQATEKVTKKLDWLV